MVQVPQLERLDWSGLAGVIALQPGTRLRITNMDMGNFSLKSDYVYTPSTPYQSVGSGVSIWPTINGAPNTTVSIDDVSGCLGWWEQARSSHCRSPTAVVGGLTGAAWRSV